MPKYGRASHVLSWLVGLSLGCGGEMAPPSAPLQQAPLQVTSVGQVVTPYIHNNPGVPGTPPDTLTAQLASGTYTPKLTGLMNVTPPQALPQVSSAQWLRVGDVVTVSGMISVKSIAGATPTGVLISLPVPSTLLTAGQLALSQLAGTGYSPANIASYLVAYTDTSKLPEPHAPPGAGMYFVSHAADEEAVHVFHFTYQVL